MAEAGIGRTGKTPEHPEDHQPQYGIAAAFMPLHPVAALFASPPGKTDHRDQQPVKQAHENIPDADVVAAHL